MKEVATYLYCVVRATRPPGLKGAPRGLPKTRRLRALGGDHDLWLIATDAPLSEYGEQHIERGLRDIDWVSRCAVAHEAVVAHFVRAQAVVPLKLFTLFASDARALAYLAEERKGLDRVADRVAGRLEWGVRLSLDPNTAIRRAEADAKRRALGASPGANFLLRKKGLRDAVTDLAVQAQERADQVFGRLGRLADERKRRDAAAIEPGTHLLLDAVYLVSNQKAASFREQARRTERDLVKAGYRLTLTGPWPAYNFITFPSPGLRGPPPMRPDGRG